MSKELKDNDNDLGQSVPFKDPQEWEACFTEIKEKNTGEKTSGKESVDLGDLDDLDKSVPLRDPQKWESCFSASEEETADLTEEVTKIREQLKKGELKEEGEEKPAKESDKKEETKKKKIPASELIPQNIEKYLG